MTTAVRRRAAALALSALLCVGLAPAAAAAAPRPGASPPATPAPRLPSVPRAESVPAGLYGTQDPSRDAVTRQSLAMIAQFSAGLRPANQAIRWLKGQQCDDGSFPTYRPQPTVLCDTQTHRDVRATALAVQALSTLGGQRPWMLWAVGWLEDHQNADGGWGTTPGAASDAASTSLVMGALTVIGAHPSAHKAAGHDGYDALAALALPCDAPGGGGGTASSTGGGTADADATAAAVLGAVGKRLLLEPVPPGPAARCSSVARNTPEVVAQNGSAFLTGVLSEQGHLDDPGSTADAVVALVAAGHGDAAAGAMRWLEHNSAGWAAAGGPAAYARLILAAHAAGVDPRHFGGVDLVARLTAQGPAPRVIPSPTPSPGAPSPSPTPSPSASRGIVKQAATAAPDGSYTAPPGLWIAAGVLALLVIAGVFLLGRRRPPHQR